MIEFRIGQGAGEFEAIAEGLALDYKLSMALLNSNGRNSASITLNKPLMERLGHSVKKGDFLKVYSEINGGAMAIVFRGLITTLNPSPDNTTLSIGALSMDYSLNAKSPGMIGTHSGLLGFLSIDSAGHGEYNAPAQFGPLIAWNSNGDSAPCPQGGYKEGPAEVWLEYAANYGRGALIYIDTPVPEVGAPTFKIPIMKEPGATGAPDVIIELWEAEAYNSNGALYDFPRPSGTSPITSLSINYDSLPDYSAGARVEDNLRIFITNSTLYAGRPYYIIVHPDGGYSNKSVYLAARAQDSDFAINGLKVIYDSGGAIDSIETDKAFQIKSTPCPANKAAPVKSRYDPATDKTIVQLDGTGTVDNLLYGPIIPGTAGATRDLLKRLVRLNNAFYTPAAYDSLPAPVPIAAMAQGAGLALLKSLAELEGWDIWPSGFDPWGVAGGSFSNYYNISTPPIAPAASITDDQGRQIDFSGSAGDILDLAIISHDRPSAAPLIKFKDPMAGDISAPLFYDLIGSGGSDFYPIFSEIQAGAPDLRAIMGALNEAIKYDTAGGTVKVKGWYPEALGAIITLHSAGDYSGDMFKVYQVDLNTDKTSTLYLSTMPPGIYSALKSEFEPIKPPDLSGNDTATLATWIKISGFERLNSIAIITPEGTGPERSEIIKDLGTVPVNGGTAHYYLITFKAAHSIPWTPPGTAWTHYTQIKDIAHLGIFDPGFIPFYEPLESLRLSCKINGTSPVYRTVKVPGQPDLIPGRSFNILLAVHY